MPPIVQAMLTAAAYFGTACALGVLLLVVFNLVNPAFRLWDEVRRGNVAVALAVSGQLIGAAQVLQVAIGSGGGENGLVRMLVWALAGITLQIVGYLAFELLTPKLDVGKELAADNRAVGVMSAGIAVALGHVVAACIA